MDGKNLAYVHLLLFRCKRCKEPLVISVMSEEGNLERIDGETFDVECNCGWFVNSSLGVEAVRHWVAPCEFAQSVEHSSSASNPSVENIGLVDA
jgi:hypothetical protein